MPPLKIVSQLNSCLEQENIRYCHWKSNEHVDAAVEGKTDLDVLADQAAKERLKQVLGEIGYKQFISVPFLQYTEIEDYVAMDEDTGTLVHLHLHYQLELGEKNLKGYHCPWEELLLSTRIYDQEHQIYIAEPNIEIIILLVRAALKVRNRDRAKSLVGADYFAGDVIREFRWLKARIDLAQVRKLSAELLGEDAAKLIAEAIADESQLQKLLSPRNAVRSAVKKYRRYDPITAMRLRWYREWQYLFCKVLKRYFKAPVKLRRTSIDKGGAIVAILGADGAGKSTVNAEIVKGLSSKVDVFPIYLGSGDGTASILRQPLIWLRQGFKALKSLKSSGKPSTGSTKKWYERSKIYQLNHILWAITLVIEKQNKLKRINSARERGLVVVCDRYPQSQIPYLNEGPLLTTEHKSDSKLLQALQEWELKAYQQMVADVVPDLVVKLNVSPEVALTRKSSLPEVIEKKVAGVKAIEFPDGSSIANLDADRSLDEVILKAKHAVWQSL
ncbi:MAG: hypothetical protein AAGE96_15365 [Cyanobacteria bacterium P01_G01_bin.19]